MAVTLTVNTDHTASLSSRYLARQGEVGALMTVTVPSAVYALGTYAYIDFTDADGVASYLGDYDASSGTFVVSVGAADNILAKDGIVKIQFVLRDNLISESYTAVWKSQIVEAIVERSVNADTYAIPAAMPSDDPPATYEASRVSIEDVGTYYASKNVEDALQEAAVDIASNTGRLDEIIDLIYPVGSLYMTDDAMFNPATTWGGTWSRIQVRMIVGASDTDTDFDVGDEGGAKTSTALIAHTHSMRLTANASAFGAYKEDPVMPSNSGSNWNATTESAGSGASFSLMNPYHASFIWKRTA